MLDVQILLKQVNFLYDYLRITVRPKQLDELFQRLPTLIYAPPAESGT